MKGRRLERSKIVNFLVKQVYFQTDSKIMFSIISIYQESAGGGGCSKSKRVGKFIQNLMTGEDDHSVLGT